MKHLNHPSLQNTNDVLCLPELPLISARDVGDEEVELDMALLYGDHRDHPRF